MLHEAPIAVWTSLRVAVTEAYERWTGGIGRELAHHDEVMRAAMPAIAT
jgi:hypothetical protein